MTVDPNQRITAHEQLCTLRYDELLKSQMQQNEAITRMQSDIRELLAVLNMGFGMWKLVAGVAVITGLAVTIWKLKG